MKITIDRATIEPHDLRIWTMDNENEIVITRATDPSAAAFGLANVIREILDDKLDKIHAVKAIREATGASLATSMDIYRIFRET